MLSWPRVGGGQAARVLLVPLPSDGLSSEASGALGIGRASPQSAPQRQRQGSFTSLVLLFL